MEFERAKEFIKGKFADGGMVLSELEEIALEAAWQDLTYEQISLEKKVSENTLKGQAAPTLWKKLSQIFGQKITKKTFKNFYIEATSPKSQAQAQTSDQPKAEKPAVCKNQIVGAALPNVDNFCGREEELMQLQKLLQRFGCVVVVGVEGIGKKSLVSKLLYTVDLPFSTVIWKPLHHRPTADQLEIELLELLEESEKSLISALKARKVLIVFESIDAAISPESGIRALNPQYMSLIRRLIQETDAQIVAISNEPVEQIKRLALRGEASIYTLRGLGLDEAKQIVGSNLKGRLEDVWQAVGGNPLMLKEVANWANYASDLEPGLANRPTVYRGLLANLHQQTFGNSRLSTIDRQLLIFIAKKKEGILFSKILSAYPSAAQNILRLNEMGLVQRTSQPEGVFVWVYDFFRQYLMERANSTV